MSDSYAFFAQTLTALCGQSFDEARITASLAEGHSKLEYACKVDNKELFETPDPMTGWNVHKKLHAIRKQMTVPGQTPWSRCIFTLFPDGKFKFDVEYDD